MDTRRRDRRVPTLVRGQRPTPPNQPSLKKGSGRKTTLSTTSFAQTPKKRLYYTVGSTEGKQKHKQKGCRRLRIPQSERGLQLGDEESGLSWALIDTNFLPKEYCYHRLPCLPIEPWGRAWDMWIFGMMKSARFTPEPSCVVCV